MGSIIFPDPKTGVDTEWWEDEGNPHWKVVAEFFRSDFSCSVFTDTVEAVPTEAWFAPDTHSLSAVPTFLLRFCKVPHPVVLVRYGKISSAYLATLPTVLSVDQEWSHALGRSLVNYTYSEALEFAVLNYRAFLGDLEDKEGPWQGIDTSGRDPEKKHLEYLKIAALWQCWERRDLKWSARAMETVETGIYEDMKEDNLRRICKTAGLLTPRTRSSQSRGPK